MLGPTPSALVTEQVKELTDEHSGQICTPQGLAQV